MNTEKPETDKLTRELLSGTAMQPSSSLMSRIMAAVMQEQKTARRGYMKRLPSIAGMAGGLAVYLLLAGGIIYFLLTHKGESTLISPEILQAFPLFLTLAAGISFFFLFSQLDKWLLKKEKEKK